MRRRYPDELEVRPAAEPTHISAILPAVLERLARMVSPQKDAA